MDHWTNDANGSTNVVDFAIGRNHICVVYDTNGDGSGDIECWGYYRDGEVTSPNADVSNDFVEIAAGQYTTCARKTNGTLTCRGDTNALATAQSAAGARTRTAA